MELDLNSKEQERFSAILTSTIGSLCKIGMINSTVTRVDGLLGITLASNTVFLVKIQEQICETEGICSQSSDVQNCNNKTLDDAVCKGEALADPEFRHLTISNIQQGVLRPPSEPVENELSTNLEVGGVVGFQAANVGMSCPPNNDSDCGQISALLQKRKYYRKPNRIVQRELNESVPRSLEDHEENKLSQDGEEMCAVYEPHHLEDLANVSCDDSGLSASACVKMECLSEDELTHNSGPAHQASPANEGRHFKSETQYSNSVLSDAAGTTSQIATTIHQVIAIPQDVRTTPQDIRTTPQVFRTIPQDIRTTPQVVRTTPQVVDYPTASYRLAHSPSVDDLSQSRDMDPQYLPPNYKQRGASNKGGRSTYKRYTRETLRIAINEIVNNTLTRAQASRMFDIPPTTLHHGVRRLKKRSQVSSETEMT